MTGAYLRGITNTLSPVLQLNVNHLNICLGVEGGGSYFIRFKQEILLSTHTASSATVCEEPNLPTVLPLLFFFFFFWGGH